MLNGNELYSMDYATYFEKYGCPEDLFKICIAPCWIYEYRARPTFSMLVKLLSEYKLGGHNAIPTAVIQRNSVRQSSDSNDPHDYRNDDAATGVDVLPADEIQPSGYMLAKYEGTLMHIMYCLECVLHDLCNLSFISINVCSSSR